MATQTLYAIEHIRTGLLKAWDGEWTDGMDFALYSPVEIAHMTLPAGCQWVQI